MAQKKTLTTLTLTLFFLILITPANADTEYLTWGVTRDNTFQTSGTGTWTGRTPVTSTRNEIYTSPPLTADVDNDNINEIIIMINNTLSIYNYTTGTGLILEDDYNIGTALYFTSIPFYQTPGLLDYDNDGFTEIILTNHSHMLTLNHTGNLITLEQSTTTNLGTGSGDTINRYPIIKCSPGSTWITNNDSCVVPTRNRTGVEESLCLTYYDLDSNTARFGCYGAVPLSDTKERNTHLADADADGNNEAYFTYEENNDLWVMEAEISSTGNVTLTRLYEQAEGAGAAFTDIIINNLEPDSGLEITWGYTADGTNWDAHTIDSDAAEVDASYCTVLTCPEGTMASTNLVEASDTTYCDYVGDVYYYIRNPTQSDPGPNIDTILCISRYAGSSTQENTVSSTLNYSGQFYIHESDLYGSTGLLTSARGIQGTTVQTFPLVVGQSWLVPVDYQLTGSLDLIGVRRFVDLTYYDDAYTNQQVNIDSLSWDTGNPLCQGEIPTFTLELSDDENDVGYCHIRETWGNGTVIALHDNSSFVTPGSVNLDYFADTVGTFFLNFRCQDQYNRDSYESVSYTVSVSNDTTLCNVKGNDPGGEEFLSDAEAIEDAAFDDNVDDVFADIGIVSQKAKTMFWLLVMIAVAFLTFSSMRNSPALGYVIAIIETFMLILGWVLGMVGTVILVIVGLICSLLLVMMFTGRSTSAV